MNVRSRLVVSHAFLGILALLLSWFWFSFSASHPSPPPTVLESSQTGIEAPFTTALFHQHTLTGLALVTAVTGVGSIIIASIASRKITAPINELRQSLSTLGLPEIADEFTAHSSVEEITDLITALQSLSSAQRQKDELLAQRQQTQKMDAIGQLAGGVAHDFNNLLGGILGAADLLAMRMEGSDDRRRFVDLITETAQRATDLTSRLLAFSRKGGSVSHAVNVHDVIRASFALLNQSLSDKSITFTHDLQADPPLVTGDGGQLQNVITHLGVNSRDAMPEGGTIQVRTKLVSLEKAFCDASPFDLDPGRFIEISFRDSGIGMPPEFQNRIFEPFFTTKKGGEGTGLGLAAVYGTVKDHLGCVTVHSEVDKGTEFHIYLPIDVKNEVATSPISDVKAPDGIGYILVVDDEEVIRFTAETMLRDAGYKVLFAANGMEAVEMFKKYQKEIDLVILDLVMPVMDGRDTLRELLSLDKNAKVMISSGFACDTSTRELLEEGACSFLRKPFRNQDLTQAIAKIIN